MYFIYEVHNWDDWDFAEFNTIEELRKYINNPMEHPENFDEPIIVKGEKLVYYHAKDGELIVIDK